MGCRNFVDLCNREAYTKVEVANVSMIIICITLGGRSYPLRGNEETASQFDSSQGISVTLYAEL